MYVRLSGVFSRATRACETPRGVPEFTDTVVLAEVLRATVSLEPREIRGNIVIPPSHKRRIKTKGACFFENHRRSFSGDALFYFVPVLFIISRNQMRERVFNNQQNDYRVPAIEPWERPLSRSGRNTRRAPHHLKDITQCEDAEGRISLESANCFPFFLRRSTQRSVMYANAICWDVEQRSMRSDLDLVKLPRIQATVRACCKDDSVCLEADLAAG